MALRVCKSSKQNAEVLCWDSIHLFRHPCMEVINAISHCNLMSIFNVIYFHHLMSYVVCPRSSNASPTIQCHLLKSCITVHCHLLVSFNVTQFLPFMSTCHARWLIHYRHLMPSTYTWPAASSQECPLLSEVPITA